MTNDDLSNVLESEDWSPKHDIDRGTHELIKRMRDDLRQLRRALAEIEEHNRSLGENGSILIEVKAIAALLGKQTLTPEDIRAYQDAHPPVVRR